MLILLILLTIMAALALGNNLVLGHLNRELQMIEQRQKRRLAMLSATNAPAVSLIQTTRLTSQPTGR